MNNKKKMDIYKHGNYITSLYGSEAVAEYTGLHEVTVNKLYANGRMSRSGYSFDRPCDEHEHYDQSKVLHLATQAHGMELRQFWFGNHLETIAVHVDAQDISKLKRLAGFSTRRERPFVDNHGEAWRYAYPYEAEHDEE